MESHPGGEENNMQEMQHEMNPDMAQMGGPHDPSRGPPEQVNYPGSEHAQEGQPQEGRPKVTKSPAVISANVFCTNHGGESLKT